MPVFFKWQKLNGFIVSFCLFCLVQLAACENKPVVESDSITTDNSMETEAGLQVSEAYFMRPIAGRSVTAAYITVTNTASTTQTLESFGSEDVGKIELHNHVHRDGQMQMRKVERLIIEPGDTVNFANTGYHLMLLDVSDNLRVAEAIRIVLHTAEGESTDFDVLVRHHQ